MRVTTGLAMGQQAPVTARQKPLSPQSAALTRASPPCTVGGGRVGIQPCLPQ